MTPRSRWYDWSRKEVILCRNHLMTVSHMINQSAANGALHGLLYIRRLHGLVVNSTISIKQRNTWDIWTTACTFDLPISCLFREDEAKVSLRNQWGLWSLLHPPGSLVDIKVPAMQWKEWGGEMASSWEGDVYVCNRDVDLMTLLAFWTPDACEDWNKCATASRTQ